MAAVAISFYIIGMLVFYTWGQVNDRWQEWYYLWDKGFNLLIFIGLHQEIKIQYRWAVKVVIIFTSIRFLWQIISSITGWNINNVIAVGILFIVLALVCSFLTLKELIKWRR